MTDKFSRDEFYKNINTNFLIYLGPEKTVSAELTEVSEVVRRPPQESFSIVFQISEEIRPDPWNYTVGHPEMGKMEIFLSPFHSDEEGTKLEAVFNFLV